MNGSFLARQEIVEIMGNDCAMRHIECFLNSIPKKFKSNTLNRGWLPYSSLAESEEDAKKITIATVFNVNHIDSSNPISWKNDMIKTGVEVEL